VRTEAANKCGDIFGTRLEDLLSQKRKRLGQEMIDPVYEQSRWSLLDRTGLRTCGRNVDIERNARVKDRLENHLHGWFAGRRDRSPGSAKAIASNWIAA